MKKTTILFSLALLVMNLRVMAQPKKAKLTQEAITENQYAIDNIEDISITQFANVELEYSTKNSISIFTDSSNHKYVKLDKTTNSMEVYLDKNRPANFHSKEMKIIIYTNQLKKLTTSKVAVLRSVNQNVFIIGNAEKSMLNCNGISKFDISQFQSNFVNIEAKSCAKLFLHAEKELQIKASRIAKIIYSGKFIITSQELNSIASVQHN
ncbi:MAG: hypothetical protein IPP53_12885 [Bacteroidetes bacterium]|nr:hypothetical protein [Bacteroidota bacterium]